MERTIKKISIILLTLFTLTFIVPKEAITVFAQDTASVTYIYANITKEQGKDPVFSNMEIAQPGGQSTGKELLAKYISGGTYTIVAADEEVELYFNNAIIDANYTNTDGYDSGCIALSGNSSVDYGTYVQSSSIDRFSSPDSDVLKNAETIFNFYHSGTYEGNNAKPYSYVVKDNFTYAGNLDIYDLTVNENKTFTIVYVNNNESKSSSCVTIVNSATVNGNIIIEQGYDEDHPNTLAINDSASVTLSGGSITGSGNAVFEAREKSKITGMTLYDEDGETTFALNGTSNTNCETFRYSNSNWVRYTGQANPGTGGSGNTNSQIQFDNDGFFAYDNLTIDAGDTLSAIGPTSGDPYTIRINKSLLIKSATGEKTAGSLNASGNLVLELAYGATVTGLNLYDKYADSTILNDTNGVYKNTNADYEHFDWTTDNEGENGKWVLNHESLNVDSSSTISSNKNYDEITVNAGSTLTITGSANNDPYIIKICKSLVVSPANGDIAAGKISASGNFVLELDKGATITGLDICDGDTEINGGTYTNNSNSPIYFNFNNSKLSVYTIGGTGTKGSSYDFRLNGINFEDVKDNDALKVPADFDFNNINELYFTKVKSNDYGTNEYSYLLLDNQYRHILETNYNKSSNNLALFRVQSHVDGILEANNYSEFYLIGVKFLKSGFRGVEVSTSIMPDNYDFTQWNGVDLSSTTNDVPGNVSAYYGVDTIDFSSAFGTSSIVSISLLDDGTVPSNAIVINGTEVTVKSNYYSVIPLKIVLDDGTTGYVKVNRIGIFVDSINAGSTDFFHGASSHGNNMTVDTDKNRICAVFYHDDDTDYNDYDLVVNMVFADGTTKTQLAKGVGDVANSNGDLIGSDYILWSGNGEQPVKVYVTAVKDGALNGTTAFGGATFGSGSGVEWINNR